MMINEFYKKLLDETINKPIFNPDFVTITNQHNVGKKRELISLIYDKLKVSKAEYGKSYLPVNQCSDKIIDGVFKRLFNDAIKAKKNGLFDKVNSNSHLGLDLDRHLEALDGAGYYKHHYHKQ